MTRRVARGKEAIDARIDLHGLTQAQAHSALLRFLRSAHARDARLVLVITGKGCKARASAACCAATCRNGWACRNSVALWSASRMPMSPMAARARFMCGCGARERPDPH